MLNLKIINFRVILISFLLTILFFGTSISQDATEIIRKSDNHVRGNTSIVEMSMTVQRPDWTREVKMKSWEKESKLSLILITAPARDNGTSFLKRGKEVWNWLPSVERVIKIPPSMMLQSWMGSDFTNDDLVKESSIIYDYDHEVVGDSIIDNRECHKIKMVPKPDAPVVWGMIFIWITKSEYLQMRVEYYDEDSELINIMAMSEIMEMGGRVIPTVLEITPVNKPEHRTIIKYESIIFDSPIKDSFFSEQNMKRLRP
jgi:outer membrane lipoprotein-sorting protein